MDIYQRLADRLDELPEGFPSTPSGVELDILRKIFTPQEAEMALQLRPLPETARDIAQRLGRPAREMEPILKGMAAKGQIATMKMGGQQMYRMAPFVVGIYEYQRRERLTPDLAALFEQYLPTLSRKVGGHGPHLTRVIPVNAGIKTDLDILPYEDVRQIIARAKSFRVQDCICRREQEMLGNPCKHTLQICLQYSMEEGAYDEFNLDGRIIDREEALRVIDQAEEEGLVHNTYNVQEAVGGFICNCCPCCCGLMRSLKEYEAPYIIARSRYVALIDAETCAGCGTCMEERCPMEAISEEDGQFSVQPERCIGCGVCVLTCPTDSIALVDRPESDWAQIAENMVDWGKRRLADRQETGK
ncbi:MAG: 4Fe-4S binding protein [Deltaproteobacteria bacterium]|nr:4Fe-4S binding protein [Deltaproteobacteria bacterium]